MRGALFSRSQCALAGHLALLASAVLLACAAARPELAAPPAPPTLTEPARGCVRGAPPPSCRSFREIEGWLRAEPLTILDRRATVGGQGASKLVLRAGSAIFEAKWRPASSASAFNDPAAEMGAHHVQALVLDPEDYVLPPAASTCLERTGYRRFFESADAAFEMEECVLGFVSYWLTGSTTLGEARRDGLLPAPGGDPWSPDPALYDPARFPHQRLAERRNLANLNVVAFLVRNGDAHTAQFVLYPRPLHVFLVDGSVAFSAAPRPTMSGRQDLGAALIVPAIPRDTAARLMRLDWDDVRALERLDEYQRTRSGWRRVSPGPLLGGARERIRREGDRVQVGLSEDDARGVYQRLQTLQRALRTGELGTF